MLVLFRLWRPRRKEIPKHKPDPERPSKPRLAREMLYLLAARFKDRMIHIVGDAAYASGAFAGLPENVTITSRLRADAALNQLPPPRPPKGQRKQGRPPKKGARLPKLSQIATDPTTQSVKTTVRRYGKTEQLMVHALHCLWYEAFGSQQVQVVIIQDAKKPSGYELALISTDLQAAPAKLIERYADRWPTEVAYEEGKEQFGVGEARNRSPKAVHRTFPFPNRPVPIPGNDTDDHLVRVTRTPPQRRHRPPPTLPLVPDQDHPVVRGHARQAPPRDHRHPISPRSMPRPQTRGNSASPAGMGSRRPMNCETRGR